MGVYFSILQNIASTDSACPLGESNGASDFLVPNTFGIV